MMESESGVTVEEERIVSERTDVEESAIEAKKEERNADINGEGASNLKEASKQGTKSEGMASKAATNVSKSKISKPLKVPCTMHSSCSIGVDHLHNFLRLRYSLFFPVFMCICLFLCVGTW